MNPLALNEPGRTILAMGNDAIVRGGLEAALGYFSTYPGTPASEIGEGYLSLGKEFPHIHAEFSVNEHVAAHGAQGASWAGIRSMVTMKHVGMNVAAEGTSLRGVHGGRRGLRRRHRLRSRRHQLDQRTGRPVVFAPYAPADPRARVDPGGQGLHRARFRIERNIQPSRHHQRAVQALP
ncbi:MAG: hypothetical protein AB2L13_11175 [Spirochaetota bacterium]